MMFLTYCRLVVADLFFCLTRRKNSASILMYHSIGDNNAFFTVAKKSFSRQMEFLKLRNFNVIKLSDLVELILSGVEIKPKTVAITFDDGYEDNFLNVFPVLRKYEFPATIFLQTGCIGSYKQNSEGVKLKILSESQIKEMSESGIIDFGGHTVSHPKLSRLNYVAAEKEILDSKKIIEKMVGGEISVFAYPFGNYNNMVKNSVKKYYKAAVSVRRGFADISSDVFELPRNSIDSAVDKTRFKLKI